MNKLNFGCGEDYKEGWINVDIDTRFKADKSFDFNSYPYPFKENTFDEILASADLEHIEDIGKTMLEFYRIGKHKCKIYILTSYHSAPEFQADFEHKHSFTYYSFGEAWVNSEIYAKFKVLKKRIVYTHAHLLFLNKIITPIINMFPDVYERLFSFIIPSSVIIFILEVRKDKEFQEESRLKLNNFLNKSKKFDRLKFIKDICGR